MEPPPKNVGYDEGPPAEDRIYLVGVGSIGLLLAHSIASLPNPPPMTLLVHDPSYLSAWEKRGEKISLETHEIREDREGFDIELMRDIEPPAPGPFTANPPHLNTLEEDDPIFNLIVTVKACNVVKALRPLIHRIRPQSTIAFVQNGMGQVDEVNEQLFPNVETRPSYVMGIISHGVFIRDKFSAVHAGQGTLAIGVLPKVPFKSLESQAEPGAEEQDSPPPSSTYLIQTITRCPVLTAVAFPHSDLLQRQLEKLASNCVLNPLTALMDCHNGELLYNFSITRVMRLLLAEISMVICALPELQGVPNVQTRFSPDRLETVAIGVISKTAKNISSMLADVRAGKETEIEYINGFIVKRGEKLGIPCALNYMMMHMVIGKQRQVDRNLKGLLPIEMQGGEEEEGKEEEEEV